RNQGCNSKNYGEEHRIYGDLRIEDAASDFAGEQAAAKEANNSTQQGQQHRLGEKDGAHNGIGRSQRFHESDLVAALKNGGGHGGGNGQRRSQQRGQRDQ